MEKYEVGNKLLILHVYDFIESAGLKKGDILEIIAVNERGCDVRKEGMTHFLELTQIELCAVVINSKNIVTKEELDQGFNELIKRLDHNKRIPPHIETLPEPKQESIVNIEKCGKLHKLTLELTLDEIELVVKTLKGGK